MKMGSSSLNTEIQQNHCDWTVAPEGMGAARGDVKAVACVNRLFLVLILYNSRPALHQKYLIHVVMHMACGALAWLKTHDRQLLEVWYHTGTHQDLLADPWIMRNGCRRDFRDSSNHYSHAFRGIACRC